MHTNIIPQNSQKNFDDCDSDKCCIKILIHENFLCRNFDDLQHGIIE